ARLPAFPPTNNRTRKTYLLFSFCFFSFCRNGQGKGLRICDIRKRDLVVPTQPPKFKTTNKRITFLWRVTLNYIEKRL
ncbi:MAG: hypothetical protein LUC44_08760, partial [Prevotellaceae bacterium]|nr:hypothetical protein [Prevotellaceae bacterium]